MNKLRFIIIISFLISFKAYSQQYPLENDTKTERVKAKIYEDLVSRFNFQAKQKTHVRKRKHDNSINGILIGGKWDTKEQTATAKELLALLKKIQYPANLGVFAKLIYKSRFYKQETVTKQYSRAIVIKKGTSLYDILSVISRRPQDENLFNTDFKDRIEKDEKALVKIFGNKSLSKDYKDIHSKFCSKGDLSYKALSSFLMSKGYHSKNEVLSEKKKKNYKDMFGKESSKVIIELLNSISKNTFYSKSFADRKIVISLRGNKIDFKLTDKNLLFIFTLEENCRKTNLLVKTYSTKNILRKEKDLIKLVHYNSKLKVIKHIDVNPDQTGGRLIMDSNTIPLEKLEFSKKQNSKTIIALLDSGIAYNHPEIQKNMLLPILTKAELEEFNKYKDNFIKLVEERGAKEKEVTENKLAALDFDLSSAKRNIKYTKKTIQRKESYLSGLKKDYNEEVKKLRIEQGKLKEESKKLGKRVESLTKGKFWSLIPGRLSKVTGLQDKQNDIAKKIHSISYTSIVKSQENYKKNESRVLKEVDQRKKALLKFKRELNSLLTQESELKKEALKHSFLQNTFPPSFLKGLTGWDLNDNDEKPFDFWGGLMSDLNMSYDHGTHVSGIITYKTDSLTLFPIRYPKDKRSKSHRTYLGIKMAYLRGARVLNISMGTTNTGKKGDFADIEKKGKIARRMWKGVERAMIDFPDLLFVVSAGNDSRVDRSKPSDSFISNNDLRPHYPSNFEYDNVLVVASSTKDKKLSYFSNIGMKTVDVAAPGSDITSLIPDGNGVKSGTSMAAPFVSRIAGKIEAINSELNPAEISKIIMSTVDQTQELREMIKSGGVVNEKRAINKACETVSFAHELCR